MLWLCGLAYCKYDIHQERNPAPVAVVPLALLSPSLVRHTIVTWELRAVAVALAVVVAAAAAASAAAAAAAAGDPPSAGDGDRPGFLPSKPVLHPSHALIRTAPSGL